MSKQDWLASQKIRSILMIKGHSAGIGDILRSSAAWRRLKDAFPEAGLHLLMLTREPGYASETLMAKHHLLAGFKTVDKRTNGFAGWKRLLEETGAFARACQPDLIIDFEPNGTRTSLVAWWLARQFGAPTVGVNQVLMRGLFYTRSSVSFPAYAAARNMVIPMDYTERDFVALTALGIERNGTPIELAETEDARQCRLAFRSRFGLSENTHLLGLSIGCGTPGAASKRPSYELLSKIVAHAQIVHKLQLVVGIGAPFESHLDREFLEIHKQNSSLPVINAEGKLGLLNTVGLINACSLFISGDSGPYHMAVGLKTRALAIFNFNTRPSYHHHPWVRCVIAPKLDALPQLIQAADELMRDPVRNAAPL
jgi:ADP-heptose:LPS heptosyltransferase